MKRVVIIFAIQLAFAFASAQGDTYAQKLRLVDSLRSFITNQLHLEINGQFYTNRRSGDSMYCYVYASKANRVEPIIAGTKCYELLPNEDSAIARCKQLNDAGYETLLYKTAGTSTAELNDKLLSYADEAIAFIIIHEATHQHLRHYNIPGLYKYEEALADAVANKGCVLFAQRTALIDLRAAKQQAYLFKKMYAYINRQRAVIDASEGKDHSKIFEACRKKMYRLSAKGNQFHKDRMRYPVNNAYFIRQELYAKYYFVLKEKLGERVDVKGVIEFLTQK